MKKQHKKGFALMSVVAIFLIFLPFQAKALNACQMAQAGYWTSFSIKTCLKKAEEGDVFSQFLLGNMFYTGRTLGRDMIQSINYFVQAANNKHLNSYIQLGGMHAKGDGMPQNLKAAYALFAGAAYLGDERGKKNMQRLEQYQLSDASELKKAKALAAEHVAKLKAGEKAIPWPLPFLVPKPAEEKDS